MSRRRRKAAATPFWVDWMPEFGEFFGDIVAGWTPPRRMRMRRSKTGFTVDARFTTDKGRSTTVTVRVRLNEDGSGTAESAQLRQVFTVRSAA